ncbi:hypothetical protein SSBG_02750 [Streptomyces sp. SPB074]|nr:hypothetical protein SSBG_02750 [Streptomyces sp. SPB074]
MGECGEKARVESVVGELSGHQVGERHGVSVAAASCAPSGAARCGSYGWYVRLVLPYTVAKRSLMGDS